MSVLYYDLVVIGGGAGGLTAAKTAHGLGKKVAIIERSTRLGGECTWTGCVPSKTLIKIAYIAHHARKLSSFGLKVEGTLSIDTSGVMDHVRSTIRQVYATHTPSIIEALGIDVYFGKYQFVDRYHIKSEKHILYAKKFIIATGSHPFVPPIAGIDGVDYLTNETLFDVSILPQSLIILGGGAIGIEMAGALNRLGVDVTVIEKQDRILAKEDPECVEMLTNMLRDEGVVIVTGARVARVNKISGSIVVVCESVDGQKQEISAEKLLVAVGRRPNIEGLYLENTGMQIDKHGIVVNNFLQTTVKNIYAVGDVVGPYQFSHMAWYQAVTAVRNAFIPFFKKRVNYTHKIWVTFASLELAAAGLTEEQARAIYGDTITIYKRSYDEIDRGLIDQADGMVKIICDKKGILLGAHILGERAGDIIHELQVAKVHGIKFKNLQSVIHAYPTYAEIIWHMSKKAYVQRLEAHPLIRLLKKIFM